MHFLSYMISISFDVLSILIDVEACYIKVPSLLLVKSSFLSHMILEYTSLIP